MIVNENITKYLHSLETDNEPFLEELRIYAKEHDVPIIRRETESYLKTVMRMLRPGKILEIGTAIGYSSIVMAQNSNAVITTIENYEKRIPVAEENIRRAGLADRISLRQGDAGEVLPALSGTGQSYDLIFLDAAKGQYLIWLPCILSLMHEGSVLIADNVLQEQTVTESRFTVPRRERTTHERMREFLYRIKHHPALESAVLSIGDGISMSVMLPGGRG